MKNQIANEARAQAKAYIAEFKKKELVKDAGGQENKTLKPTNTGTNSKKESKCQKKKSKDSSKELSKKPGNKS